MIVNIQEQLSKEWKSVQQVNYSIVFVEKQQLEDSLTLCMNQYEERLRRVNEYMESSNSSYLQAQEELKSTRLKQDEDSKARDQFLT